jgi:hypothetical protein
MHSAIERVAIAAGRLPPSLQQLFRKMFHEAKSDEEICQEEGITMAEQAQRRTTLMRSLMAAAGPARESAPAAPGAAGSSGGT